MHVMSENLRQEYDRQLVNIRNLRALYEERARISAAEKENLNRQIETSRAELNAAVEKYVRIHYTLIAYEYCVDVCQFSGSFFVRSAADSMKLFYNCV